MFHATGLAFRLKCIASFIAKLSFIKHYLYNELDFYLSVK